MLTSSSCQRSFCFIEHLPLCIPLAKQVFDAFLHSFTTYRSVLSRIKNEYDAALDDALASIYDNVHMRAEMASAEEMMVSERIMI